MRKVSHKTILRHVTDTHLATCKYFEDDCWYRTTVKVDDIFNLHSDFRRFVTPVGMRYVDIWSKYIAPLVATGAIDFMPATILPPSAICCLSQEGQMFVIDGSLRVFNAIQFGRDELVAYVWRPNG